MAKMTKTANGGNQMEHSGEHAVEFFSKAGSLFAKRQQYYGKEASALELFKNVWRSGNHEVAMKLLFWLRAPRGGAGNRSGFRECASWLSQEAPEWLVANAINIPKYGRYDDLQSLYTNEATANAATAVWVNDILSENVLAAKWADITTDKRLLKAIRKANKDKFKDIGDVRRFLAKIRNGVVEVAMTKKEYAKINYSQVPSVAMSRYTKAFNRNDSVRFLDYKAKLEKAIETGDKSVKVNAGALFPHDCIRTVRNGDKKVADAQFASLPNFMSESGARILPIADTSGSMCVRVSGDIQAIDISLSLAYYCSDRLGKENPFYRKFLEFSSEGHLVDWTKYKTLSEVYAAGRQMFEYRMGSTDIQKALNTVLKYAQMFNATKEQMPNYLLIISDMQFDGGSVNSGKTVVNEALAKWEAAGYDRPQIIYWNTAGNAGSPEKSRTAGVSLVSGFSPSILKAIFGNPESMNPYNVMMNAIKDYEVVIPQ